MFTEEAIKDVSNWIKESVEWLQHEDCGCSHYHYGDVCIVVGWMPGYDKEKDDTIMQSANDPTWAINAGVRTNHDYMCCDMDCDFNYLYWPDNGECWNCDVAISPDEDYEKLAKWFLENAEEMNSYQFADDGKIIRIKE